MPSYRGTRCAGELSFHRREVCRVYSALDATERVLGTSTVSLKGQVEFENGVAPVEDPERAAELASRLRRSWRRFAGRERTPREESALSVYGR